MTAAINIEGLAKRFSRVEARAPLELQVPEGQILGYLGDPMAPARQTPYACSWGFCSQVAAGLNTVPPGILVLGLGTMVQGLLPRYASPLAYGLIAWSFLVELVGSMVKPNHYFLDLSIFHHMALAPAAEIRWDSAAIFVGFGIGAAVLGVLFFNRRDLAGL